MNHMRMMTYANLDIVKDDGILNTNTFTDGDTWADRHVWTNLFQIVDPRQISTCVCVTISLSLSLLPWLWDPHVLMDEYKLHQ